MKKSRITLVGVAVFAVAASTAIAITGQVSAAPTAKPSAVTADGNSGHPKAALPLPAGKQTALLQTLTQQLAATRSAARSQPNVAHLAANLQQLAGVPGKLNSPKVPLAKDGTVAVTVSGPGAVAAATAVGARIISRFGAKATVSVKPSLLRALAARPGVSGVAKPIQAIPQVASPGLISQGVIASGAQNWTTNHLGNGGTGVNIAIVDAGFGQLQSEIAAGHLGAVDGSSVKYLPAQNYCGSSGGASASDTDHGTAVAEIVHQMAPNATLYLYCVSFDTGFAQASADIVTAGNIQLATSSLGFTAGAKASTEAAVKSARDAGVLWIQSAGNSAQDHWAGNLVDAANPRTHAPDGVVDLLNPTDSGETDATLLDPGFEGRVSLSWTPSSGSVPVALAVQEYDRAGNPVGQPTVNDYVPGDDPFLEIDIANSSTNPQDYHEYDIAVFVGSSMPAIHYDLSYDGDVYPSYLSSVNPARAAAGSIVEPAASASALSVGASNWRTNSLEPFSSRGPTVDGRVKPDLLGFDGTASNIADVQSNPSAQTPADPMQAGFYGTSAAAPHVAGAAALILAANLATSPATPMTAQQISDQLMSLASPHVSPPTNAAGSGLLQLVDVAHAGSCSARAVAPATLVIDRPDVAFAMPVSTNCTNFVATAGLSGPAGSIDDLFWTTGAGGHTSHFVARANPTGSYNTTFRGGIADQGRVTWTPSNTVAKYVTIDSIASSRVRQAVYINGLLKNYSSAPGLVYPTGRLMYLQRYLKTGWQTMLSRPVDANGRWVVGFIQPAVYQYRLVAVETATSWSAGTASTFR